MNELSDAAHGLHSSPVTIIDVSLCSPTLVALIAQQTGVVNAIFSVAVTTILDLAPQLKGHFMSVVHDVTVRRHPHGHHEIAAAIFVGSLLLSTGILLAAELMKPERYEFHPGSTSTSYVIYDRNTGRATNAEFDSKTPIASLAK